MIRNCIFMDESSFVLLYKSMVRPHLEYANSVWCPHKLNQFKTRLDKFWLHQDILYDFTADLTGIGDRSVHVTKDE